MRGDWFSGPLLSRHFVEHVLPRTFAGRLGEASADAGWRRMRRWLAAAHAMLGPASGLRALCDVGAGPLFACLGYRLRDVTAIGSDLPSLTTMLAGTLEGSHGVTLRIVIAPWQTPLDQAWRFALQGGIDRGVRASTSPSPSSRAARVGVYGHVARRFDTDANARWTFCFNGRRLRLGDIDRPYARRFLEFDLRETLNDADRSRLLWAFARPAAFATPARARPALVSEIVAACDAHGVGVREALQGGVREALELLCAELARTARQQAPGARRRSRIIGSHTIGSRTIGNVATDLQREAGLHESVAAADVVSQGLTLLYRVLFLLFAEARALVPVWHPLYRDSYTIGTLHRQAECQTPRGLWEGLQAISRLAHAGCETDGLTITAFNSQLFSPDGAPLIDRARIDSTIVARILQSLMTTPGAKGRGRERITYADLGVEQLGAVYERVLDYAPHLEAATASRLASPSQHRDQVKSKKATSTSLDERSAQTGHASSITAKRACACTPERTPGAATSHGSVTLPTETAGVNATATATPHTVPAPKSGAKGCEMNPTGAIASITHESIDTTQQANSQNTGMRRVVALRSSGLRPSEERIGGPRIGGPRISERRQTSGRRTSVRRKESGTFYTPRSMADYLVRETLAPLTATADADRILSLRVLDPAMGSGAFLVSACRFLAQAYEQALAREDRPLPATDAARAEIRRTIARQCLFGVDLNPMAVQLARLSLWLTTLTTDAPLTFLDHHLRAGDSLVGASLDDLARRRPAWPMRARSGTGRRAGRPDAASLPLFTEDDTSHLMRSILPSRAQLTREDDRPETVHEKERLLASLARDSALSSWLTLADLWCASWFWPAIADIASASPSPSPSPSPSGRDAPAANSAPPPTAWAALCDQVLRGSSMLPAHVAQPWLDRAREVAARQRFFHWTLEFPEVFFETSGEPRVDGGFDAIVGNPPWDMVREDVRRRGTETGTDGEEIDSIESGSRAAVSRFVRESGIYDTIGDAHPNSYQLFVARSLSLLRRDGGRLGLVVPWGLAADHGSARLRRRLLERCDVDTMISFDNRDGLFPIHRSLRFLLFTATTGGSTAQISCRFGERDPAVLDRLGDARTPGACGPPSPLPLSLKERGLKRFLSPTSAREGCDDPIDSRALTLAPALLRRMSGEGLAFPDIRSRECLSLLERMHAAWPALTSSDGWGVTFGRELHASDDRWRFEAATQRPPWPAHEWPVIEGKHLHPFQVRLDETRIVVAPAHRDAVGTRVPGLTRHRLAYRDVSSATNRQTLIAAIVPPHVVTTHTLFCLRSPLGLEAQHALCGLMNSFVANYFVRLRVSTHVTIASLDHLPMPTPGPWIGELAAVAESLSTRPARAPTSTSTSTSTSVAAIPVISAPARLQALAARAYGITLEEFRHVLSTFPLVGREEKEEALDAFVRLFRAYSC